MSKDELRSLDRLAGAAHTTRSRLVRRWLADALAAGETEAPLSALLDPVAVEEERRFWAEFGDPPPSLS
jgi:hypothetical protein